MKASFKEIKSDCGLLVWICQLNGKEICRSLSQHGVRMMVINIIRKNQNAKQ